MSLVFEKPDEDADRSKTGVGENNDRFDQRVHNADSRKFGLLSVLMLVFVAWLGGVLTHVTVGWLDLLPSRHAIEVDELEQQDFSAAAIDYRLSYHREPIERLVTIDADDKKGRAWLGGWVGFTLPAIDLDKLGDEMGYELKGYDHYSWGEKKVVVGIYSPKDEAAKDGPIFVCLSNVRDGEFDIGDRSGFSRKTNFVTDETTSRHDDKHIGIAAVGATSNTILENLLEKVVAEF